MCTDSAALPISGQMPLPDFFPNESQSVARRYLPSVCAPRPCSRQSAGRPPAEYGSPCPSAAPLPLPLPTSLCFLHLARPLRSRLLSVPPRRSICLRTPDKSHHIAPFPSDFRLPVQDFPPGFRLPEY